MILSDVTIIKMLEEGSLKISPISEEQIQPASVDIRLGDTFSVVTDSPSGILTLDREISYHTIKADTYLLLPGQFVLATTKEFFALPDDLTAFVEGRSSLGRMGCLSKMPDGSTRGSAEKSRLNCITPTGLRLN